jgi:GT2 family glycosyltransferase
MSSQSRSAPLLPTRQERTRPPTRAGTEGGTGYGLRMVELSNGPQRVVAATGETGLGVVLRDQGRIVGFKLIGRDRLEADGGLDSQSLVDREVREAITVGRLRNELGAPAAPAPSVTVAICSKDRWDWVDRLLTSLEPLRAEGAFEVMVIDNASSDDRMRGVCAERDWVRYFHEPLVGLNFARNRAVREAGGEVVAFLDDDVVVDRDWLRGLGRAWAENPDAGCVTGLVLPMALQTEAQILFEAGGGFRRGFRPIRNGPERYGDPLYPCGAGRFGAGANMSLRRDLVLRLGGFDEALDTGRPLPGGGDLDIFYRVLRSGATLVYEPQAAVYHEHRREIAALRRQYYTWGVGFMAFVGKSMESDPAMRGRFRGTIRWWFRYQARRLKDRIRGREPIPARMILGEIWGGVVGLCGGYRRSKRRIARIRAEAAPKRGCGAAA